MDSYLKLGVMKKVAKTLIIHPARRLRHALQPASRSLVHLYQSVRLFGRKAPLVPPLHMMHDGPVGYRIFKDNGQEFLRYYIQLCNLTPDERILDVGSGIGRKTISLIGYLSPRGRYEGMDIVATAVKWCSKRYARRYPNFRFQHLDVFNKVYNPNGSCKASEFTFPFDDKSFDFVVLASVFTHMLPDDLSHYLSEVARVLRDGGRCLISFFFLNQESLQLLASGRSSLNLKRAGKVHYAKDQDIPEQATGYDEDFIVSLYRQCGLEIKLPIQYGSWCGRQQYLSYQDLVVATKQPL